MTSVWTLLIYVAVGTQTHGSSGGPLIIDNIASHAECERVAGEIHGEFQKLGSALMQTKSKCLEVKKTLGK